MSYSRTAVGLHSLELIRVEVSWTPEERAVQVAVRDAETRAEYGTWQADHPVAMPYTPDHKTLDFVVWCTLGTVSEPHEKVLYARHLANYDVFTWVPERLAGGKVSA